MRWFKQRIDVREVNGTETIITAYGFGYRPKARWGLF